MDGFSTGPFILITMNRRSFFTRILWAAALAPIVQPVLAKLAKPAGFHFKPFPLEPKYPDPAFWVQSTRWSMCTDAATEAYLAKLRDGNKLYRDWHYTTDGSEPTISSPRYGEVLPHRVPLPSMLPPRPRLTYLEWSKKFGA